MAIDKSIPIPLYYQLAESINERIDAGVLKPGDQLPPERELAEEVGISRMTARQAVAYLEHRGVLEVKPGIGTFVVQPKLTQHPLHLLGFTEAMIQRGWPANSQVLEQEVVVPPARVASGLKLQCGATALKIVRLRLAKSVPLLLETIFIPAALCLGLEKRDLVTHSLYAILEREYGLNIVRAQQTLEATSANEYEAELFGIDPGLPLILLEGITYFDHDNPLEYFKAVYRSDRFKFELESQRDRVPDLAAAQHVSMTLGLK